MLSHNGPVCYTFIRVKSPSEKERSCKNYAEGKPERTVFCREESQINFEGENQPKLLYVSEIRPDASAHPRVMHAHEDFVELILICSGSSEYLIHDKKVIIKPGDLLVYNAGVVHDEVSGPDMEVGSYRIAVGGLHMSGLRENALIPDDAGYVFPTGKYFADLRCLFEMMFRTLSAGEPNAELFCSSLMHALLVSVLTVTAGPRAESEEPLEEPHILGRRIKEYIDKHYMEPITLQSMGEALHISPYYLSHVFKQMSGYSPVQYLLRRRIGEAQTLLITTDLSITRIAEMVGYDTQSYFNLQFTKTSACRRISSGRIILCPPASRRSLSANASKKSLYRGEFCAGIFDEKTAEKAFSRTERAVCCGSFCTHIPCRICIEFREMGSCCAGQKRNDFIRGRCARCGNVLLQVLGFVYRVVLSRFAGAEGLGVYRLVNSVYLVLNAGCLSGVTTACSRLSAACEARGESGRLGAVLQLAFRAFLR